MQSFFFTAQRIIANLCFFTIFYVSYIILIPIFTICIISLCIFKNLMQIFYLSIVKIVFFVSLYSDYFLIYSFLMLQTIIFYLHHHFLNLVILLLSKIFQGFALLILFSGVFISLLFWFFLSLFSIILVSLFLFLLVYYLRFTFCY